MASSVTRTDVKTSAVHTNPQLPGVSLEQWAHDVLTGLGVPADATNVDTLMRWATAESGGGSATSCAGRFNPLNTTEGHFGYACQGGSQGNIKGFSSYQQGVQSIVWNLTKTKGAGYERILDALRGSNQAATFSAIDASSFGTHFGGNPPGLGGTGSVGTGPTSPLPGGGTDATLTSASGDCPEGYLVNITMPGAIPNLKFSRCNGRAWLGAFALVAGTGLLLAGFVLIGIGSTAGRRALNVVPGVNA